MIKYYDTEAAYAADAKSPFESQVSLIGASNAVKFDGCNVIVGAKSAKTGSIVVLDGNSAMHFVAVDTFSSTSFMSNYTVVGVVAVGVDHPDFRGKLVVLHKNNTGKQWSAIYSFRLTGYTLDSTERTVILSVREASDSWAANHDYTITYNAGSVEALAEQLNTFFKANAPFTTQNWRAEVNDGAIDLKFIYTNWQQASYNTGKTGFTLEANLLPGIPASSNMYRKNGQRSGEGTITNWERAIAYFSQDLPSGTYNPATDVTSPKMSYPICKPAYLGTSANNDDHCSTLRAIYGEGEEGWLKFMASFLPVRPTSYGPVGDKAYYGDSFKNTYLMVGKKFTKQDNTEIVAFPAADYCADVVYNHELLKKGKWALPDMDTLFSIMKTIKYGTNPSRDADPVNRALNAIGGNAVSNGSYVWSASRYGASYAWCSYGTGGYALSGNLFNAYSALPVALLDIRDSEL